MVTPRHDPNLLVNPSTFDIESEVLSITDVTSEKFVPGPSKDVVLGDLIIVLKRFRNAIRWKAFFHDLNENIQANGQTEEELNANTDTTSVLSTPRKEGLKTNL